VSLKLGESERQVGPLTEAEFDARRHCGVTRPVETSAGLK
jgi:hypothetical protein